MGEDVEELLGEEDGDCHDGGTSRGQSKATKGVESGDKNKAGGPVEGDAEKIVVGEPGKDAPQTVDEVNKPRGPRGFSKRDGVRHDDDCDGGLRAGQTGRFESAGSRGVTWSAAFFCLLGRRGGRLLRGSQGSHAQSWNRSRRG